MIPLLAEDVVSVRRHRGFPLTPLRITRWLLGAARRKVVRSRLSIRQHYHFPCGGTVLDDLVGVVDLAEREGRRV